MLSQLRIVANRFLSLPFNRCANVKYERPLSEFDCGEGKRNVRSSVDNVVKTVIAIDKSLENFATRLSNFPQRKSCSEKGDGRGRKKREEPIRSTALLM